MALRENVGRSLPNPWLAWLAGLAGAVAMTALAAIYARFPGDPLLARWIQGVHLPGVTTLGEGLYYLGVSPFFGIAGVAVAALFLCARHRLAASFLLVSLLARGTVGLLKDLAERPRPTADLVRVSEQANGFSFPSGHVLGSVLLWGFLCYLAAKTIPHRGLRMGVQAVCLSILFLTGLQRIYAGAHWPSDVLGGYLWGGLLLVVIIKAYEFCQSRLSRRHPSTPLTWPL